MDEDTCQYEPIVGAFSGLVHENAPCMRCGKPKAEHRRPDLVDRLQVYANAQMKNHLPLGEALIREAIAALLTKPNPADERLEDFKTGEWMVMEQVCPHCGKKPSDGISDEELSGAGTIK